MFKMQNGYKTYRKTAVYKLVFFSFLLMVASCEELTEGLTPRDNIVDTWKCAETGPGNSTDSFLVEIEADAGNSDGVKIYNFNHLGDNFAVKATISGFSISIPNQTVDGFAISGSGSVNSNYSRITLSYSVDDGGGKDNYSAVLTKP